MNRVVSLLPSSTEIIHALGCGERIVGRSHECDYPAGIDALPPCTAPKFDPNGTSREIDERVKAVLQDAVSVYDVDTALLDDLAPDLVVTQSQCELCAVSLQDVEAAVREMVRSEPDVLSLEPNALGDVWRDIASVAAALGVRERGEALLGELQGRLDAIAACTQEIGRMPRVACIEWYDPLMAAGNWVPELVEVAGGEDVLGVRGEHSAWLEWAALEEANPEVIALMPCGFDIARSRCELAALTARAEWARLEAVQRGEVFVTDGNQFFNRPGPRLVESAEILAEILHPDAFAFGHEGAGWERLEARAT